MINRLNKLANSGFTLMELLLSLTITSAIFAMSSESLIKHADAYSFIANRKSTVGDLRFAVNRMSEEMRKIEAGDINSIGANSINFRDANGNQTSYRLDTYQGKLAVYRGTDLMIPSVGAFSLEYLDGNGIALAYNDSQIPNIKRIKLSATTDDVDKEGNMTIATTVVPRSFIGYTNYQ